jgi:hypothetical protein
MICSPSRTMPPAETFAGTTCIEGWLLRADLSLSVN